MKLFVNFWYKIFSPYNRPGNQLREKRYEKQIVRKALCRSYFFPVYLYGVTYRLKGIERYTYRKYNILKIKITTKKVIITPYKKIGIFKIEQTTKVYHYTKPHIYFSSKR